MLLKSEPKIYGLKKSSGKKNLSDLIKSDRLNFEISDRNFTFYPNLSTVVLFFRNTEH